MEVSLHTCDVSQQTRDFEVVKDWTYLLFEEFFQQGDLEKSESLPVSMLCDRDTTNVAGSQPGFIGFVVMPLFVTMQNVISGLDENIDVIKSNTAKWKAYQETDQDKEVYKKKIESKTE